MPDPKVDQPVGGSLCHSLRNGQNNNVHGVALDVGLQLIGRINGDAVDLCIDHIGRDVKGGVHGEAGVFKGEVVQQCAAQVADTDHDEMVIVVHTQNVTDLGTKFFNVVSISLLAKLTETTEILTDLRSGNIHFLPQRVGGGADNIPAQVGFKLLTLFKLTETDQRITIGLNLPSGEMGRKDLIKIENTFLTDEQVNQLSLYAPQATVNRIDDYEVVGKSRPSLPDRIDSVLVCPNSNCISHAEPVSSSFAVKKRADDIALKCKYCEKEFSHYVVLAN